MRFQDAARDARAVADRLGAPFYALDLSRPFAELIGAFSRDYAEGRTPNPCVVCNQDLKFGELMTLADDLGCAAVVTGHYARLEGGRLRRAVDGAKDQSYLLHGLTGDVCPECGKPISDRKGWGASANPPLSDGEPASGAEGD